jgi:hypothetical protein
VQSFSDPSPAGLTTTFYCLRFANPPTWRARCQYLYPTGTGWPSDTPRHWVPFSSPPTTRWATVKVFEPESTRVILLGSVGFMWRPTVSRPVSLGIKHPSGASDKIFICQTVEGLLMWAALSDERTDLSFTIAADPRQGTHSRVQVPWISRPYFTDSDSRLPFSSPPTTRRVTVEVFDPFSTRVWVWVCVMLRPTVSRPVCLRIMHPSGAYDQIFITVRQLRVYWCGALSLTRGRVSRLQ